MCNGQYADAGRREIQCFLFGYLIISLCEIFTVGGFPLNGAVRRGFSAVHIAAVVATAWVLLLNAIIGFQIMEDGTPLSMALIIGSSLAFIVGVGYIALDTAFSWTGYWDDTLSNPNRAYALYTLYLLVPLVFIVLYFVAEAFLVVVLLGERRPLRESICCMNFRFGTAKTTHSIPSRRRTIVRARSNLPIRRLGTHLQWRKRQNQWRHVRDVLHATISNHDLGVLVQHNRG